MQEARSKRKGERKREKKSSWYYSQSLFLVLKECKLWCLEHNMIHTLARILFKILSFLMCVITFVDGATRFSPAICWHKHHHFKKIKLLLFLFLQLAHLNSFFFSRQNFILAIALKNTKWARLLAPLYCTLLINIYIFAIFLLV